MTNIQITYQHITPLKRRIILTINGDIQDAKEVPFYKGWVELVSMVLHTVNIKVKK